MKAPFEVLWDVEVDGIRRPLQSSLEQLIVAVNTDPQIAAKIEMGIDDNGLRIQCYHHRDVRLRLIPSEPTTGLFRQSGSDTALSDEETGECSICLAAGRQTQCVPTRCNLDLRAYPWDVPQYNERLHGLAYRVDNGPIQYVTMVPSLQSSEVTLYMGLWILGNLFEQGVIVPRPLNGPSNEISGTVTQHSIGFDLYTREDTAFAQFSGWHGKESATPFTLHFLPKPQNPPEDYIDLYSAYIDIGGSPSIYSCGPCPFV